jgi:hypothetical protein
MPIMARGYHGLVYPQGVDEPIDIPESDEALLAQCEVQTFRAGGPGG